MFYISFIGFSIIVVLATLLSNTAALLTCLRIIYIYMIERQGNWYNAYNWTVVCNRRRSPWLIILVSLKVPLADGWCGMCRLVDNLLLLSLCWVWEGRKEKIVLKLLFVLWCNFTGTKGSNCTIRQWCYCT